MLWAVQLRTNPAAQKKRVSAAEQLWFKLPEGNAEFSAPMPAEPNGGMPTRNWSTIAVNARSSAAIVGRHLASAKTAPGNIAPTTATLQTVSTEVSYNDNRTASG